MVLKEACIGITRRGIITNDMNFSSYLKNNGYRDEGIHLGSPPRALLEEDR